MVGSTAIRFLRRSALPIAVFGAVLGIHVLYLGLFPEGGDARAQWALPDEMPLPSWWRRYVETQSYFLGFSYALSLAFAAWALRRYREENSCDARKLAIGGITLSGLFAVAGCYLLGCCGSPMLVVYLNLFGASFLPLAKPLVACLTLLSVGTAAWWLTRRSRRECCRDPGSPGAQESSRTPS
jgi:hypothetical protein